MKSASELAQELGISGAALRNYRVEAGIAAKTRSAKYSESEVALIRAVAQRRGNKLAQPIAHDNARETATTEGIALQRTITATWGELGAMGDLTSETENAQNRILARLEAIESKIDALMALFDKAVIASRYISRAAVDSASGKMPAIPHETRPRRGNGDVPRLSEFAELHGVKARTALDHSKMHLIATKDVPLGNGKSEHYVTKEQQAAIIVYWKSIHYPFTPCPDCPHESEAQE